MLELERWRDFIDRNVIFKPALLISIIHVCYTYITGMFLDYYGGDRKIDRGDEQGEETKGF